MLKIKNTALLVIDIQGKLAQSMYNKEKLFQNLQIIIKSAQILKLPIIWMEQLPKKIGPTIPELVELLNGMDPIEKSSFSCCDNEKFLNTLSNIECDNLLLVGIETHICVYQTAIDLLKRAYNVHTIADAVSSREAENKRIGLKKIESAGGSLTTVETVLFELLKTAEHKNFSDIVKLIK
ncbi:MAG: hydrolase [Deltaproteobacteria bacterium]|nr:hydrolase [Deltaproteobacteria bacterium]